MCGRNQSPVVMWALRAIAAGAGGKELAAWTLEASALDEKERQEAELNSMEAMTKIGRELRL